MRPSLLNSEQSDRFNIADFLVDRHVREGRGAKAAILAGGQQITYADLAREVNRVGNALVSEGVDVEQRVMLVLPDGPEFVAAYFGAMKIGAVAVPTSTNGHVEEYSYFLTESRAKILFVDSAFWGEVGPAIAAQRHLRKAIVCGTPIAGQISWDEWLREPACPPRSRVYPQGRRRILAMDVGKHGAAQGRRSSASRLGRVLRELRSRCAGNRIRR